MKLIQKAPIHLSFQKWMGPITVATGVITGTTQKQIIPMNQGIPQVLGPIQKQMRLWIMELNGKEAIY